MRLQITMCVHAALYHFSSSWSSENGSTEQPHTPCYFVYFLPSCLSSHFRCKGSLLPIIALDSIYAKFNIYTKLTVLLEGPLAIPETNPPSRKPPLLYLVPIFSLHNVNAISMGISSG